MRGYSVAAQSGSQGASSRGRLEAKEQESPRAADPSFQPGGLMVNKPGPWGVSDRNPAQPAGPRRSSLVTGRGTRACTSHPPAGASYVLCVLSPSRHAPLGVLSILARKPQGRPCAKVEQ